MKKLVFAFLTVMALAAALTVTIADSVSAAPALPQKGTICWVQDANMVTYVDDECEYHQIFKLDEAGHIVGLLNYQDHGHIPPGAALPTTTMIAVFHVDCNCIFDGDYRVVLAPNGEYHSQGPMQ